MKDPAFLFYPGDWNLGTIHLTTLEKGAYLELLVLQFAKDKFTEAQAKHMLNGSFELVWSNLKDKFKTDGIFYWNERLQIEKEKRKTFTESRRNNGLAKKNKGNSVKNNQEHMDKHMGEHMEDENKYSISIEEKLEKMIVKEMMAIWMKIKPRYKLDEGLDFTACLDIAYRIGIELGIEKSKIILLSNTTNLNDLLILQKWEEYLNFIVTDNYLNSLTISGVANKKNWHSLLNKIEYKPNEDKERLSESKRITPEQYFKN